MGRTVDKLARRSVAESPVRTHAIIMIEPSWQLFDDSSGVGAWADTGVIALERANERLCHTVALRAFNRSGSRDQADVASGTTPLEHSLPEMYFSMADIAVIAGLIFAGLLDVAAPAECDALVTWYDKMQERPSVKNRITMSDTTTA